MEDHRSLTESEQACEAKQEQNQGNESRDFAHREDHDENYQRNERQHPAD